MSTLEGCSKDYLMEDIYNHDFFRAGNCQYHIVTQEKVEERFLPFKKHGVGRTNLNLPFP